MSGIYPSLEDMAVDQMSQAQNEYRQAAVATAQAIAYPDQAAGPVNPAAVASLYPTLEDYMGLDLSPTAVQQNMPVVASHPANMQVSQRQTSTGQTQIAPITGNSVGLQRAEIKQGVRQITLCKDDKGVIGLRIRSLNKGLFVAFVHKDSPAAIAGLRFGDQILQIDGDTVAGWSTDKAHKVFKNCPVNGIKLAVRDRPFERTITLQKDSMGHVGFVFKENKINSIVKDSSAARNGVLTEHHMVEVNGQNVVGLKEKEIKEVFENCGRTVTITILPSFIYEHIVKSMGSSLIKKYMDHSIPDV